MYIHDTTCIEYLTEDHPTTSDTLLYMYQVQLIRSSPNHSNVHPQGIR